MVGGEDIENRACYGLVVLGSLFLKILHQLLSNQVNGGSFQLVDSESVLFLVLQTRIESSHLYFADERDG